MKEADRGARNVCAASSAKQQLDPHAVFVSMCSVVRQAVHATRLRRSPKSEMSEDGDIFGIHDGVTVMVFGFLRDFDF